MSHPSFLATCSAAVALALCASAAQADPRFTSWFTANSGQYARVYTSVANETSGTKSTTWSRGAGIQSSPVYADINEILYSPNWVYVRTSGLASHMMGPWPTNFPNFPANTATLYRIPRVPTIPTTKVNTGLGATGRMVNGVSMFDSRDAFSYSNANAADAVPNGAFVGDGIWNRDGYHNEGPTFDQALAHQAGSNYHYHAQPIGLRHQLGDHVDYNAATNRYTESAAPVTQHSPILAWAADGLPVYGPYGYVNAMDANSGLKRIVSGYALRDGSNGTTAITVRQILPAWAQRIQNKPTLTTLQYGPPVNGTYLLGHYIEDFDFRGDLGQTQGVDFDLNEQNVRFCVTPDFPSGTWAYFTTITAAGTPFYPYTTGRQFYGSLTTAFGTAGATTAAVMNADTPLTTHFQGGPNKVATWPATPVAAAGANVTLTWSAVEGGTYEVSATPNLTTAFTPLTPTVTAADDVASAVESGAATGNTRRFYKITRTALATFDANGFNYTQSGGGGSAVAPGGSAARGTTVTVTITLPTTPPQPPANLIPAGATLAGTIVGTSISRPAQGTVLATFVIPANAPTGAQNVVVTFSPGPTYTLTGGFTIN